MRRSSAVVGRLAFAVLCLPILPGASGRVEGGDGLGALRRVESRQDGFRARLPRPLPVPLRSSRLTVLGRVEEVHYAFNWNRGRVSVEIYDIPRVATLLFPSSLLLDQAADGVVEDMEAREIERRPTERAPHPAQVVTYELPGSPPALERALIVLAESRLYVVVVTGLPGAALDPALEHVIESFEIVGP